MILPVQEYLKTHSLSQLKAELGIKSSAKPGDYFFSLNYDQIESKAGPVVNQCRGLVLGMEPVKPLQEGQITGSDPVGETVVYARPFDRFFNMGDGNAAPVDLEDPETMFFEKLDGTLCILWWNPEAEEWNVATRAVPMADKPITGWEDLTFRKLFERALTDTLFRANLVQLQVDQGVCFQRWTENLNKSMTYIFELTTPLNRIVVEYKEFGVWLLGVRETATGQEQKIEHYGTQFVGVPVCPYHKLNNQQELLAFVGSKPPFEQEGVVVRDRNFNRMKVKSLAYMAYNRVRDSTANSPRAIMELILTEKLDDVLPVLEGYIQSQALKLQEGIRLVFKAVDEDYLEIAAEAKGQPNERKAFALGVQDRAAWMAPLMDRFLGKCISLEDYIQKRRNPDGSFPDALLDNLIQESNRAL
jgi:hypothetical protein